MERSFTHHPDSERFLAAFRSDDFREASFLGVTFRSAEPAYATERDLLAGIGSRKFGGRWNAPGSFATVYVSADEATAWAEAKAHFLYYGWDPVDALPRTLVAVDVRLHRLVDLRRPNVRKSVGVSATQMRSDDWRRANRQSRESLTQAIGRAVYSAGLEGMIAPACNGRANLVWFPGNLLARSRVVIRNADRL